MNQVSDLKSQDRPKTSRGRRTQAKLLEAAEAEFGERGFHDAAISGITTRAGVAMGTFYNYFESKEEIFRVLVEFMGKRTRSHIAQHIANISDRLEAEKAGLIAFLNFAKGQKNLYRIVMEAQFVAEDAYKRYYYDFANAYRSNLDAAAKSGQIREGDNDVRAWGLIGLSVFLGLRFAVWDERESADKIAETVMSMLSDGLSPDGAGDSN
ncbi:MAG: TetR/AcrR family transcriptional regulator [Maricaulaceae bacterium]